MAIGVSQFPVRHFSSVPPSLFASSPIAMAADPMTTLRQFSSTMTDEQIAFHDAYLAAVMPKLFGPSSPSPPQPVKPTYTVLAPRWLGKSGSCFLVGLQAISPALSGRACGLLRDSHYRGRFPTVQHDHAWVLRQLVLDIDEYDHLCVRLAGVMLDMGTVPGFLMGTQTAELMKEREDSVTQCLRAMFAE